MKKPTLVCSAIIPTVGRPTLRRAVESVLAQHLSASDLEVIVVNDSGVPLLEADWHESEQVRIISTNRRERSVARNTGAAVARGQYLHFLDDDDWLVPDAYQHLTKLSRSSEAKWIYGMTQLVDRQNQPLLRLRHALKGNCFVQVMAGEWIPLQSSWIDRATFLRLGGFNPLLAGPEDIDLLRRVLLEEDIAETQNIISHLTMGADGSTTDYDCHPQASRWARENILDSSNAYFRLHSSAVNPFWHGRKTRIYLTSVIWNVQQARLFAATGRLFLSIASALHAGIALFAKDFWRAVLKPYASITFARGFQEIKQVK